MLILEMHRQQENGQHILTNDMGSLVAIVATYMDSEGPCRQLVSTDRSDAEETVRSSKVGMHNLLLCGPITI